MGERSSAGWTDRLAEAFGLTKKDVAERLGFSGSPLSRWDKQPNATRVAVALARTVAETGCRIEWIVFGEPPMRADRPSPRDAAATFARACGLMPEAIEEIDAKHPDPNVPNARDRFHLILAAHQRRLDLPPSA